MLNLCSLETLKLIYYSHIQSHIAYGICVYGTTKMENLTEILKVQKRAVRVMLHLNFNDSVKEKFKELKILTVYGLFIYEYIMFLRYNPLRDQHYFIHSYNTRHKNESNFPSYRLEFYKKKQHLQEINF
ncbi:hypothetical protein J6590_108170 [Homalodisca vitripennis]|nr:hypothetical protein J6590_108170 [Homalodisca vitripennis]